MVNLDVPEVRVQAIQEIINLLMFHGSSPYTNVNESDNNLDEDDIFEVSFY